MENLSLLLVVGMSKQGGIAMQLDDDTMEILTDHVCDLADLRPTNEWPAEVRQLVGAARAVKKLYGMEVVKIGLGD